MSTERYTFSFSLQNAKRLAFQELKKEATANSSSFDWASYEDKDLIRKNKFYFSLGSKLTTEQLQQVIYTLINALDVFLIKFLESKKLNPPT